MEGVEDEPDGRMVRAPHDLPGVAVIVDVPAPGQRLEADAQPALCGALAKLVEIGRGAVDAAERVRRDVAAHQQQVAAEFLHQVELALGALENALARGGSGMPSKSRKGWKVMVSSPRSATMRAHIGRACR